MSWKFCASPCITWPEHGAYTWSSREKWNYLVKSPQKGSICHTDWDSNKMVRKKPIPFLPVNNWETTKMLREGLTAYLCSTCCSFSSFPAPCSYVLFRFMRANVYFSILYLFLFFSHLLKELSNFLVSYLDMSDTTIICCFLSVLLSRTFSFLSLSFILMSAFFFPLFRGRERNVWLLLLPEKILYFLYLTFYFLLFDACSFHVKRERRRQRWSVGSVRTTKSIHKESVVNSRRIPYAFLNFF